MSHILIAYLSRADENYYTGGIRSVTVGNTAKVALALSALTHGQLFEIKRVQPYPHNYHQCTSEAQIELNHNARPDIVSDIDVSAYDVLFLGYPMWWGTMPLPVFTFLERHQADLAGKDVYPFCTHEGSGFGHSLSDLKRLLPQSHLKTGFEVYGHVAQENLSAKQKQLQAFAAQVR